MPQLPTPLRAALGLAAEAVDQARHLPDRAIELPMLAVSTALQLSVRAQQRYAQLAARGDELLNHTEPTDEPPPWATFDEPVPDAPIDLTVVDDEPVRPADLADAVRAAEADAVRAAEADAVRAVGAVDPVGAAEADGADEARPRKRVRRPRNTAPSPFDAVGDD